MKSKLIIAILLAATLGAGAWVGQQYGSGTHEATAQMPAAEPAKKERKLLYYRDPMGLPDTSPVPKKDSMGMDYIAVYEDGGDMSAKKERKLLYYRDPMGLPDTSPVPKKDSMGMDYIAVYEDGGDMSAKKERKLLYYRDPMGLSDTSPVPKKDSMGMDYIAVYEDGDDMSSPATGNQIRISVEKVQKLGVRTEAASLRELVRTVRAVGRIEPNERRIYTIAPKFEGWIEQLHVNATGDVVNPGQALFEVYSPDLIGAQREYLIAAQGVAAMQDAAPEAQAGMKELAQSSLLRLKNWDITEDELQRLRATGEVKRTMAYRSPVFGIVLDKPALKGMRFMPGEMMYKIADLSTVWIIADVFEQDIGLVKAGQAAKVRIDAYPEREFETRVAYVYPTLNVQTRTTPVRLEIANTSGLLRPGMYAHVELAAAGSKGRVVTVPDSAVIQSGRRAIVLVVLGEGRYEAREVKLGMHADDYIEIREGIAAGDKVVVSANFLIDAESNLKAAIGGMSGMDMGSAKPDASEDAKPGTPMTGMTMPPPATESKPSATQHKGR